LELRSKAYHGGRGRVILALLAHNVLIESDLPTVLANEDEDLCGSYVVHRFVKATHSVKSGR